MNVLAKILKIAGVTEFSQLTEEEKETYRKWDEILAGRKLTDEDVVSFLNTELEDAIGKMIPGKLHEREDIFLKMKIDFIRRVKGLLSLPETEKKILEQNISKMQ